MLSRSLIRLNRRTLSSKSLSSVPIIDFSKFRNGNEKDKAKVSAEIFAAFKDIGFVAIVNHGMPDNIVERAFKSSQDVFSLPHEIKKKYAYTSSEANRGYLGIGMEKLADGVSDIKETFEIGNDKETRFANHWPSELPEFKKTLLEYYYAADALHLDILGSIGIALNLGQDYFTPLCNGNHQNLRLLHYPSCAKKQISEIGQKRAGEHTDYGTLTLLVQEEIGGLQAKRRDGVWIDVPPTKGAVIINVGDCLMRWSNDILVSTPHRVIQDPRITSDIVPPRFSIAFFCNPNKETLVQALPNTFTTEQPPKYKPINAFDYLVGRLNDTIH